MACYVILYAQHALMIQFIYMIKTYLTEKQICINFSTTIKKPFRLSPYIHASSTFVKIQLIRRLWQIGFVASKMNNRHCKKVL